jgi:hypothetical protein
MAGLLHKKNQPLDQINVIAFLVAWLDSLNTENVFAGSTRNRVITRQGN